jgi:ABC-type nitrate/sulfonate/bicarbonate transport system permease component
VQPRVERSAAAIAIDAMLARLNQLLPAFFLIGLLVFWELAVQVLGIQDFLLPSPTAIIEKIF